MELDGMVPTSMAVEDADVGVKINHPAEMWRVVPPIGGVTSN
jgi:hypothetical protein